MHPSVERVVIVLREHGLDGDGHPSPLRTLVDESLHFNEPLWAAAGHLHAVFALTYSELVALTGGTPAVVGD